MGDFEYAPYEDYADPAGEWPGTRPLTAWPPADEFGRIDGSRQRGPAGWPPVTGYPPQDPRRDRGYQAPGSPRQAYQPGPWPGPARSGPMPVYRDGTGPMPTYPPDSGPIPRLHPESEPAAYARPRGGYRGTGGYPVSGGYKHSGTALLSGPSPISGPMPAHRSSRAPGTAGPLLPGGRRAPGWLPFSRRLVLLPKGLTFDGEEQLREHRDVNGGWLRPAVFGAMDGLVTNSSLIAGIGGGGGGHGAIVLTGIAGLIAGAFSMATGEYISVKSQNELTLAEVELERKQHVRDPEGKRTRLTEVYMEKGVSPNLAEAVVRQISADLDRAVDAHVREELGIDSDDLPSPQTAAVASFASFTVGALIPLSPFLLGYPVLDAALVIAGASAIAGGAAVANLTGRSPWLGGLRQFAAAFLATGMAFVIGHLVGAHVG